MTMQRVSFDVPLRDNCDQNESARAIQHFIHGFADSRAAVYQDRLIVSPESTSLRMIVLCDSTSSLKALHAASDLAEALREKDEIVATVEGFELFEDAEAER
jgi:hypothetical protein